MERVDREDVERSAADHRRRPRPAGRAVMLYRDCATCHGQGEVEISSVDLQRWRGIHHMPRYQPCPTCDGRGRLPVAVDREAIRDAILGAYGRSEGPLVIDLNFYSGRMA